MAISPREDNPFALPADSLLSLLRRDAGEAVYPRWIFLRVLGICFLSAFVSLWMQVDGLIGSHGILPAAPMLAGIREAYGDWVVWQMPSLLWLNSGDASMHWQCAAGVCFSILLIFNIAPAWSCAAGAFLYLSLCNGDQMFMSFQWDTLLVETGFAAIFFAPWRLWPKIRNEAPPPWPALWIMRLLFFRLVSSGIVKLSSGDPYWHGLTAMIYHYESQPLPTWIGWWAHQLPGGVQRFSTFMVLAIELSIPFFIFTPRRFRRWACGAAIMLQMLIELTGNYAFFNLLTMGLCALLLDDEWLATSGARALKFMNRFRLAGEWIGRSFQEHAREAGRIVRPGNAQFASAALALMILLPCNLAMLMQLETGRRARLPLLAPVQSALAEWRLLNTYGLFAVMTTGRKEISIEGSNDGMNWRRIPFKWKPGAPNQRPQFVAPHQPRLDWQMWFAALGDPRSLAMIERLMQCILDGNGAVMGLMGPSPFENDPPKYVRAVVDEYSMTHWGELKTEGAWWKTKRLGVIIEPMSK